MWVKLTQLLLVKSALRSLWAPHGLKGSTGRGHWEALLWDCSLMIPLLENSSSLTLSCTPLLTKHPMGVMGFWAWRNLRTWKELAMTRIPCEPARELYCGRKEGRKERSRSKMDAWRSRTNRTLHGLYQPLEEEKEQVRALRFLL